MRNIIKKETKELLTSNCLDVGIRDINECIKFIVNSRDLCYDRTQELRQELMKYKNNRIVRILIKLGVIHV